jgi:stress-induced morphogen
LEELFFDNEMTNEDVISLARNQLQQISKKKIIEIPPESKIILPSLMKGEVGCEENLLHCFWCDERFSSKKNIENHMKKVHMQSISMAVSNVHACTHCNSKFKSIGNLHRHQVVHVDTRDYVCHICAKGFKLKSALKYHQDTVHAPIKVYVNCPYCKTIVLEKSLKTHIHNKHTTDGKQKLFECNLCDKMFKNTSQLKRHEQSLHNPINRGVSYACNECDITFDRQRDLKQHSFMHFDGTYHECKECCRKFKSRRALTIHLGSAMHNSSSNFPCELCDAVFRTVGGRRKHLTCAHESNQQNTQDNKNNNMIESVKSS